MSWKKTIVQTAVGVGLVLNFPACRAVTSTEFSLEKTTFSYAIFETSATSVVIEAHHDFPSNPVVFTDITIDDGTNIVSYELDKIASPMVHTMSPGNKRVTVTSGGQLKLDGSVFGLYVDKVIFSSLARKIDPKTPRILVYGDSLALGGQVEVASREAWPLLLRDQYTLSLEVYGYRMLYDDVRTLNAGGTLIPHVRSFTPDYIWIAIGTNDYAFSPWSPNAFGSGYETLLEALHEASPNATVFAQSPIRRLNENINGFNFTLEDYRQAIKFACLSKATWCVSVDGTDLLFPQPDELARDGVHLTVSSNIEYAEAVRQIINTR